MDISMAINSLALPMRKVAAVMVVVMAMFAASVAPSMGSEGLSAVVPDSVESILDAAFGIPDAEAGFWGAVSGAVIGAVTTAVTVVAVTAVWTTMPVWVAVGAVVVGAGALAYVGWRWVG